MLTARQAVLYLVGRGLISTQDSISSDLLVEYPSAAGDVIEVSAEGRSFLLKHASTKERSARLLNEVAVYALLDGTPIAPYLARCFGYDARRGLLVLEGLPQARNLLEHHLAAGKVSTSHAVRIGRALGALHALDTAGLSGRLPLSELSEGPHWALSIHLPTLGEIQGTSGANFEIVKIMQQFPAFCNALDTLRYQWERKALVHADIKWPNVVACTGPGARRHNRTKIIDWELARLGDPCWDIGSAFADYLAFWLLSVPVIGDEPPDRYLKLARYPIEGMQPAIRAFWKAYTTAVGLKGELELAVLLQAVRFAAARLVQTAYEQGLSSGRATGNIVCLLQLSMNILSRPEDAALSLLGIWPIALHAVRVYDP